MADTAPARRCSMCAIDWPDNYTMYSKCPHCSTHTDRISNGNPMSLTDARREKLNADFEAFYEKWDAPEAREQREAAIRAECADLDALPTAPDGPSLAA